MNFENENFIINPHFIFKEIISDKIEGFSVSSLFDIFIDNDGDTILAFPFFDIKNPTLKEYNIALMSLKNNEIKKKLEGHISRFKVIKYFYDEISDKKYLVSSDRKNKVIIWDINNNYSKVYENIFEFKKNINDVLMLFINKEIFILIASLSEEDATKIINLNQEKNFEVKSQTEFPDSKGLNKFSLSHWHKRDTNIDYIIQTGINKIIINALKTKELYATITTTQEYPNNISSFIYNKNGKDFALITSNFGIVIIYDLINKQIFKEIKIENAYLINTLKWNENIFITINANKKAILLIDSNNNRVINSVEMKEIFGHERFMRKVRHPIYGEALISVGNDYKIKLYIDKNQK